MCAVQANGLVNKLQPPATGCAVLETVFTAETDRDFFSLSLKVFGLSGGGHDAFNTSTSAGRLVQASNPATKEEESKGSQVRA